jgi:putative N6-adenine-specific DNA methylase
LKHKFAGSTAWVISSQDAFLEKMGLKPSKKIKLLNGKLDCSFCRYDLFKGKRNDFLAKKNNLNIQQ